MAEEGKSHLHMYQDSWTFQYHDHTKNKNDHDQTCTSSTSTSSIGEESTVSNGSSSSVCCSSDDTADDASSSSSSSSNGSLYDLSEIMTQLPIKRGLSKFYQGKSESFTSLSRVTSVEDLVKKKATPYRRKLKASKSCGNGLISNNSYRTYTLPKATISKKPTRGCSFHHFQVKKGVS